MSADVASANSAKRPAPLASREIPVHLYDLTLFWPVRLEEAAAPSCKLPEVSPARRLGERVARILQASRDEQFPEGRWRERSMYPRNSQDDPDAAKTEYAEYVYFHPFVRDFLYVSRDDVLAAGAAVPLERVPNRNLRLLERVDLQGGFLELDFELPADAASPGAADSRVTVRLHIRHVELYLFDTGLALLAVKLDRDGAAAGDGERLIENRFTLETVLKLQDVVRRAYAPYWEQLPTGRHAAGHCPLGLRLLTPAGQTISSSFFGSYGPADEMPGDAANREAVDKHLRRVLIEREPYAVELWRELLAPLRPRQIVPEPAAEGCNLGFAQIEDDRLGLLSYLAVPDPRRIAESDWLRLAVVDDPGDSQRYPFSPAFMDKEQWRRLFYDRFWSDDGVAPAQAWHTTRWLCCGYGFSGVGRMDEGGFYTDRHSGARAHFRQHYAKLGLIAHFHRASLLTFKYRLSEAVEELRREDPLEDCYLRFQDCLTRIERDLLVFRNMYWFKEVSNQIQGQELFDLWCIHLRTRELFDQVFEEAREASQVVVSRNERQQAEKAGELAEESTRLADQQTRLTAVASLFLLIQPLLILFDPLPWWSRGFFSFVSTVGALLLMLTFWRQVVGWLERVVERHWVSALLLVVLALVIGVCGGVLLDLNR